MRVAVVGAGSWGMALAYTLSGGGTADDITLWARRPALAEEVARTRRNPSYLSEIALSAGVHVTSDLRAAVERASIVILAVPTHGMRDVATTARDHLHRGAVVVSAAKGFEDRTRMTMSGVLHDVLGDAADMRIVALSGPNIAVEVARGLPAATVAGGSADAAAQVRDACTRPMFRVYSSEDRCGVEYAGALNNILAIA